MARAALAVAGGAFAANTARIAALFALALRECPRARSPGTRASAPLRSPLGALPLLAAVARAPARRPAHVGARCATAFPRGASRRPGSLGSP